MLPTAGETTANNNLKPNPNMALILALVTSAVINGFPLID